MEIKSTLLNDKEFEWVKNSILNADSVDGEGTFRVKLIEYINDSADNDDDKFFYDMLPQTRFLKPGSDSIAYTDPNKRIFLNAPCKQVGKNFRQWDFIYDHECLHQLWDTFAVGDKIKANGIKYDHILLNIVSDCVINDYLSYYRKKDQAPNTVTPEYLEEKYGVKYNRKTDTQYSLYLKCLEELENIKKDPLYVDPDKKIKPKQVDKSGGPTPPQPPQGKHSEDFKKGWVDAIKDVVNKKVDPTDSNLKPKNTGNDEYDAGYNSAIANMKEGLENGISVSSDGGNNNNSGGSDLPDIPWDMDNDNDQSGDDQSGDDSNDDSNDSSASEAAKSAQDAQAAADAAKKAAGAAQDAADAANEAGDPNASDIQDAADEAKEAANKAADSEADGDDKGAAEAAQDAADAADKAKKAADEAGNAAKQAGETASESDDESTQKAGENSKKEGDNTKDSVKNGKDGNSNADNNADKNSKSNNSTSKTPGKGHVAPVESDAELEKLKKNAEDIINDYKNRLSGVLGDFISKCKSSVKLEKDGLVENITKGVKGWNTLLDQRINKYVKQKVFQKKREWQSTYSRIKRGTGYVKKGEVLQPGRRVKDDKMIINVAFYLDRSGSMGSSLNTVFEACYIICEALKKRYRKENVVEDVIFKILAFDTSIEEIQYGKKCSLGGGTMSMSELLQSIKKHSNNYMINVVITDGQFDINDSEVKRFINDVNGIVIYIVNNDFPQMEKLSKELNTKLFFIKANSDFKIDK